MPPLQDFLIKWGPDGEPKQEQSTEEILGMVRTMTVERGGEVKA